MHFDFYFTNGFHLCYRSVALKIIWLNIGSNLLEKIAMFR